MTDEQLENALYKVMRIKIMRYSEIEIRDGVTVLKQFSNLEEFVNRMLDEEKYEQITLHF